MTCLPSRRSLRAPFSAGLAAAFGLALITSAGAKGGDAAARARDLHRSAIVLDTHVDTPQRMIYERGFDLGTRHSSGSIDIPRMREGGLDAAFFSIWMSGTVTGPEAVTRALRQIDAVHDAARRHPADLLLATSVADVRRAHAEGKIAVLMGMEGGHMIGDDLAILRTYTRLGVRYLTLTHNHHTNWADASRGAPRHGGLTPFGRHVVRELNSLGVMVDVSHVSDATFDAVLKTTTAPVIASHSSCRAISSHPRNMSDAMIAALAANGGVIMINYNLSFLSGEFNEASRAVEKEVEAAIARECRAGDEACGFIVENRLHRELMDGGRLPRVTWEKIVQHIEHAVQVAGIDHVGLGSDFDGASMPIGMDDVTALPRITEALLSRGHGESDVRKILGENLLRVMSEVERVGTAARQRP